MVCLGCKNKSHGPLLKELMQTNNFRVTVVEEYDVVEICGALKVSWMFGKDSGGAQLLSNSLQTLSLSPGQKQTTPLHKNPRGD